MKKTCTNCKQEKSLEDFSKVSGQRGKYRSHCKKCRSEASYARQKEGRQDRYEARYMKGDTKVGFCGCGDYYIKKDYTLSDNGRKKCFSCRQKEFTQFLSLCS